MRNLSLFHTDTTTLPGPACVSAVSIDLDHGDIYIASERETSDGDMIVEVWKAKGRGGSINHDQACDEVRHYDWMTCMRSKSLNFLAQYREISLITTFTTPEYATPNPWSNCKKPPELASFRLLPDSRMLAFTMRGGEVATANMDDEIPSVSLTINDIFGLPQDHSRLMYCTGRRCWGLRIGYPGCIMEPGRFYTCAHHRFVIAPKVLLFFCDS